MVVYTCKKCGELNYLTKLVVRGIEIRRHDTPDLIKQFQTELLTTLFDCESREEIINEGYEMKLLKQ